MIYILLGPLLWLGIALAMIKGRKRMRILREPYGELPHPPPLVSVLVPAKDEEARIAGCIESIRKLDYPNLQIIAIDDRSTDSTATQMRELAAKDARLTVIDVSTLPPGWSGKNHALDQGVRSARGEWLLFVDADVTLSPTALSIALRVAIVRQFGMISLLPGLTTHGFWEQLMQPLCGGAICTMFLIALNNYNQVSHGFACGQFILVRRDAYEAIGGHASVRGVLSEDTALARRLKDGGFRPRLAWGDAYVQVRMYDSFPAITHGWARNYFIGTRGRPWRILVAAAFVIAGCFSAFIALFLAITRRDALMFAAGLAHWSILTAGLSMIYRWCRVPWGYALLFPLGGSILLLTFLKSLLMCLRGRVEWRGTSYRRDPQLQFSRI